MLHYLKQRKIWTLGQDNTFLKRGERGKLTFEYEKEEQAFSELSHFTVVT